MRSKLVTAAAGATFATLVSTVPATAQQKPMTNQPSNLAGTEAKPSFMPPGMMMGPGTLSADAMNRQCDPRNGGFSGWRVAQFERALDLTDDQKKKLEDFKTASAKALDDMVATCAGKPPLTPTGRLELMEKRLTAELDAVKAMRKSFEPFYASLTDEQKARLTADPLGRGWRWETVGAGYRR